MRSLTSSDLKEPLHRDGRTIGSPPFALTVVACTVGLLCLGAGAHAQTTIPAGETRNGLLVEEADTSGRDAEWRLFQSNIESTAGESAAPVSWLNRGTLITKGSELHELVRLESSGGRGSSGVSSAGGAVDVRQSGVVRTEGRQAHAVVAQSIGGGGTFFLNQADPLRATRLRSDIDSETQKAEAAALTTAQRLLSRLDIPAAGSAEFDKNSTLLPKPSINLKIGGSGGRGGDGGAVGIEHAGTVQTGGDGAFGIFAQSIGGGGSGTSGNGGAIHVSMMDGAHANIHASGDGAHDIVAQSLGGGGGLVADAGGLLVQEQNAAGKSRGLAKGAGGTIDMATAGDIRATGAGAYGIFAQSGVQKTDASLDDARRGGNIVIAHSGDLAGGSANGAAVFIDGGAENTLTVAAGSHVGAASGMAVKASFGKDTVHNYGTIEGGIDLVGTGRGGANAFTNHPGSYLSTRGRAQVVLGENGTLTNAGSLDIGGTGTPAKATITGHYTQTSEGALLVDVFPSAAPGDLTSDRLTVTGNVELDGTVRPSVIATLLPGRYEFLEAGGVLSAGAGTVASWPSHVPISWVLQQDGRALSLVSDAHFASPQGVTLTDNQMAVAEHLQQAWDAGSEPQAGVFAQFLNTISAEDYADTLDSMSPENSQASAVVSLHANGAALKAVMSCPAFAGTGTLTRGGECVWGRVTATRSTQRATGEVSGYRLDQTTYRIGAQNELRPDWFVGMSAAYGDSRIDNDYARSKGDSADLAIALKHQRGNWLFAGSAAVGYGWYDNRRTIEVGNERKYAISDSTVRTAGLRLRAGYQFAGENWCVKPQRSGPDSHAQAGLHRKRCRQPGLAGLVDARHHGGVAA